MTFTSDKNKGLVFNIQKFSLHDGEGIRTLVFFKGCPLSCTWCSNPEGQSFLPELTYNTEKCIGTTECTMCKDACTKHAVEEDENHNIKILRNNCDNCGECADVCPSRALEMTGMHMSVDEVIKAVEEDGRFYVRSGGGITLSGGDEFYVLTLLSPAPIVAADLISSFEGAPSYNIDDIVFEGLEIPIPEPPSVWLILLSLAALVATNRVKGQAIEEG